MAVDVLRGGSEAAAFMAARNKGLLASIPRPRAGFAPLGGEAQTAPSGSFRALSGRETRPAVGTPATGTEALAQRNASAARTGLEADRAAGTASPASTFSEAAVDKQPGASGNGSRGRGGKDGGNEQRVARDDHEDDQGQGEPDHNPYVVTVDYTRPPRDQISTLPLPEDRVKAEMIQLHTRAEDLLGPAQESTDDQYVATFTHGDPPPDRISTLADERLPKVQIEQLLASEGAGNKIDPSFFQDLVTSEDPTLRKIQARDVASGQTHTWTPNRGGVVDDLNAAAEDRFLAGDPVTRALVESAQKAMAALAPDYPGNAASQDKAQADSEENQASEQTAIAASNGDHDATTNGEGRRSLADRVSVAPRYFGIDAFGKLAHPEEKASDAQVGDEATPADTTNGNAGIGLGANHFGVPYNQPDLQQGWLNGDGEIVPISAGDPDADQGNPGGTSTETPQEIPWLRDHELPPGQRAGNIFTDALNRGLDAAGIPHDEHGNVDYDGQAGNEAQVVDDKLAGVREAFRDLKANQ